ncbi:MAG: hypothetical protein UZ14_CFX002001470, partial [Chloroflexi bacterium OLB14]
EPGSADFSLMNDKHINHTKFMKLIIRSGQKTSNCKSRGKKLLSNANAAKSVNYKWHLVKQKWTWQHVHFLYLHRNIYLA